MDGVTILNTWTEVHVTNWIGGLLTVIFFSLSLLFIPIIVKGLIKRMWKAVGIGIGGFVSLAILILFSFSVIGQPKHVQIYEVTISDDVSFNKFMERYTILKQRGNIYTVEDKNNA